MQRWQSAQQERELHYEDPDYHHHTMDDSAIYHKRHANDAHASNEELDDDEDYLAMYQDPQMYVPQEHDHASTEKDISFSNTQRRLDPQDHIRRSTASQLEFHNFQLCNNPQYPSR
ncbi:hypothetical protein EC968_001613 [Mortierella alpina]|nr:hypothetical protein EC968_001613 [Mortierella alpina]